MDYLLKIFEQQIKEKEKIIADSCLVILLDQMLTMHYYLLFDGAEDLWRHTRTLYNEHSVFRYLE